MVSGGVWLCSQQEDQMTWIIVDEDFVRYFVVNVASAGPLAK